MNMLFDFLFDEDSTLRIMIISRSMKRLRRRNRFQTNCRDRSGTIAHFHLFFFTMKDAGDSDASVALEMVAGEIKGNDNNNYERASLSKSKRNDGDIAVAKESRPSRIPALKSWLWKWHLPLMLFSFVIFGYLVPTPGEKANDANIGGVCLLEDVCVWNSVGSLCVSAIFLISGLKLKTEAIKKALKAWKAFVWGVFSILIATATVSFVHVNLDFDPQEFSYGLALFFCMPTTLSSGVILVGQAKGNVALALMLTVVTNLLGVFVVPFSVDIVFSSVSSVVLTHTESNSSLM